MCGQTCCLQLVGVNGYLKRWSNTADIDHVYHQARGFIDRDFDFGVFWRYQIKCKAFYMGRCIMQSVCWILV